MTRRSLFRALPASVLGSMLLSTAKAAVDIEVYKTASCGCCGKWVEHLQANGFNPSVILVSDTAAYEKQFGVPDALRSCHTAVIGKHTIEGHVPAADIHKLLKAPGKWKGLAVPGMPLGSPGMEQGSRRAAYSVIAFDAAGQQAEFTKYEAQ